MITVWPSLFRPAEGRSVPLRALLARIAAPKAYEHKDDVPRWAFGTFVDGYRNLDSFVSAAGIALDFDTGATAEQIGQAFGDWSGLAYSTWTPGRWRVGILLDRPVDREDHERVWRACAAIAERSGLAPDMAARDASRCWALPAMRPGYEHLVLDGALLDVGDALERFPAPEPLPEPERCPVQESYAHLVERASRYVAKMPGAISGSGGHTTTMRCAVVLVRGFHLEPKDALRLLTEVHNPLCAPPWSKRELEHKIRQAYQRGRLPVGFLADRPRERRSA